MKLLINELKITIILEITHTNIKTYTHNILKCLQDNINYYYYTYFCGLINSFF